MVAIGVVLLTAAAVKPSVSAEQPLPKRAPDGGHVRFLIPLVLLLFAGMWLLRVRSYFLGDQQVWLDYIHTDRYPLFSEPLAALAWRGYVFLLRILAIPPLEKWLAILPVLCGIVSALLAWQISRYMSRDWNTRVLGLVLIATLGTTQLYFGYFESYAVVTVAVLLYTLAGLRHTHGEGSLLLVGLSLALGVATHFVVLFLIPSYLLLILRARASAVRRVALVLLPIFVAAGVAWLLEIRGAQILRPFEVLRVALLSSGLGRPQPANLAGHLADFANLIFLTMPVPALLILSRAFAGSLRTWAAPPERAFLLAAAVPGIFVAAALVLPGSPAQDWDLMSVTALPAALFGIFLGLPDPSLPSNRLRLGLAMLAFGPLLAFILVNADEGTGARRFKIIIDPSVALSSHERAYANEKLVKYYISRQDADSTLVYAQRAMAAESGNPRFCATVGTALYNLHRYAEAARYFEEAIRGGLDRGEVYYQLGLCYMREHRYDEALAKFRVAANLGDRPEYLHNLGMAMLATGDADAAHSVWNYVREHWPEFEPTALALERHFGAGQERIGH
jgi:tetratricopeptide (TPR) repeat protein